MPPEEADDLDSLLREAELAERGRDADALLGRPFLVKAASLDSIGLTKLKRAVRRVPGVKISEWSGCLREIKAQLHSPGDEDGDWRSHFDRTASGSIRPTLDNAARAFDFYPQWGKALRYDSFGCQVVTLATDPLGCGPRIWQDIDDIRATQWLQTQGIYVSKQVTKDAVTLSAMRRPFHPVRDYLTSLKWDGEPRIDTWMNRYMGARADHYTSVVGCRWLISAVARVMEPGCQADYCLVIEGPGAIGKTSALGILGGKWYYSESQSAEKIDTLRNLQGKWIVELNEGETFKATSTGRFKSFLSDRGDRYRDVFGTRPSDRPRQNVFAMTIDHRFEHDDDAGGRRFWIVTCSSIALKALERDRDNLWAEALDRYRNGSAWHVTPDVIDEIRAEQMGRQSQDVWASAVLNYVARNDGLLLAGITTEGILADAIQKPRGQWNQGDKMRVGRIMRRAGYAHTRTVDGYVWRSMKDPL